jgi:hypothetical protein
MPRSTNKALDIFILKILQAKEHLWTSDQARKRKSKNLQFLKRICQIKTNQWLLFQRNPIQVTSSCTPKVFRNSEYLSHKLGIQRSKLPSAIFLLNMPMALPNNLSFAKYHCFKRGFDKQGIAEIAL